MTEIARPQILEGAFQFAYVTRDVEAAAALFERRYGVRDISIHDISIPCVGQPEPCVARIGVSFVGERQIELIEPVRGAVAIYADALPAAAGAVAFHHVGVRVRGDLGDWARRRQEFLDSGARIALEGGVEDRVRFAYFDTLAELGHYIEYIWLGAPFLTARAAA